MPRKTRPIRDPRLDKLIAALARPLSDADKKGGWDTKKQTWWLEYLSELREGMERPGAPHVIRWMDYHGISDGPLLELAVRAQPILPKGAR